MGKKDKPNKSKIELDSEECELFLNAFYQGEIKSLPSKKDVTSDQDLFLEALQQIPTRIGDKSSTPRTFIKAKKKKLVDAKIDLHGMYADQAIMALSQFLSESHKKGYKKLLVVHGKGSGVLRNAVWGFIEDHYLVNDFQVATGKMGGEGALLVRINQKARK